jgi:predicted transcriptional regulator
MKLRKIKKVRIQLVVSEQVNHLLDTLAEKERKTRSVIAELAIQAYEQKK